MLKYILLILSLIPLLFVCNKGFAQMEKLLENDSLLKVYLSQSRFDIDTNAQAVVLFEKGIVDLTKFEEYSNTYDEYSADYTIVKIIKILNPNALEEAIITLPFSNGMSVKDIKGKTINLVNGIIKYNEIDKKDIIKEAISGSTSLYKFNLKNTRSGSIIFYTFKYKIDLSYSSKYSGLTWEFQNRYPTLNSEFELLIAPHSFYKVTPKNIEFEPILSEKDLWKSESGVYSTVYKTKMGFNDKIYVRRIWHRSNILPSISESYILNSSDHLQKLNFLLINGDRYLFNKVKTIPKTWDSANSLFYYENLHFGKIPFSPVISKDTLLDKLIEKFPDKLDLANSIYKYFRDSIYNSGVENTLDGYMRSSKKTNRRGSKSSNYNLFLTQILRHAGFKAFPVILSTTDNEKLSSEVFEPDKINYTICLVVIKDQFFYVDASSRYLPFGILKPECYNDFAWLINEKGLPISMNADSLFDKNTCMATLKPTDKKGTYTVKMDQRLGNVSGTKMRTLWAKDSVSTQKLLDKNINQLKYKTKITSHSLSNIYNPDTPLVISYNLELELDESGDYIYLNPFFKRMVENNPFKDVMRKYPVEFENAMSSQFILKFQLPEGYILEDPEKPINLSFNNGTMVYNRSMLYDPKLRMFSLNSMLRSRITKVAVEDYKELRSFYEAIVADQNKSIVLKKIN